MLVVQSSGKDDVFHEELKFSEWCILHDKSYSTEQRAFREDVFNQNALLVKSLNMQYKERYTCM